MGVNWEMKIRNEEFWYLSFICDDIWYGGNTVGSEE